MIRAALLSILLGLTTVTELQAPITNRVIFVVDISGSMRMNAGTRMAAALDHFTQLAEDSADDFRFGVVAFNSNHYRWRGWEEDNTPGWALMPNPEAIKAARAWIVNCPSQPDGTNAFPALEAAGKDTTNQLTIILITDGVFNGNSDPNIENLWQGVQNWRESAGLPRAKLVLLSCSATVPHGLGNILQVDGHFHEEVLNGVFNGPY